MIQKKATEIKQIHENKEDIQLNNIDKMKLLQDKKYSNEEKDALYTTYIQNKTEENKPTEYENLKEYYANNSALNSKNYKAYEIINQYLEYKVKANENLEELKKKGIKKENEGLTDKEKTQLLVDSKYTNPQTEAMYINVVASDTNKDKYENVKKMNGRGNKINTYLDYVLADKESDKKDDGTKNGETIKGSKKKKVVKAIQNMNLNAISKIYLLGTEYNLNTKSELNNYYTLKKYISEQSGEDQKRLLKTLNGKKEMKDGSYKY